MSLFGNRLKYVNARVWDTSQPEFQFPELEVTEIAQRPNLGLAFSGGCFRATLFHLGVARYSQQHHSTLSFRLHAWRTAPHDASGSSADTHQDRVAGEALQGHLFGDICLYELPATPELYILSTNLSEGGALLLCANGIVLRRAAQIHGSAGTQVAGRPRHSADGCRSILRLSGILPASGADLGRHR